MKYHVKEIKNTATFFVGFCFARLIVVASLAYVDQDYQLLSHLPETDLQFDVEEDLLYVSPPKDLVKNLRYVWSNDL